MKYGYTIFYVNNVQETIAFYEKAFGFQKKFVTPENDYGELISGETTISFASIGLGNANFKKGFNLLDKSDKPVGMEMAFVTENIEKDFQKAIEAGASEFEYIKEKPWGQKVGYLRDLNGIIIEICTPIDNK
ncbi:VOC family protein [Cyclobacterium amurskyense]|uniref:Lactoylglutathione lyase n=1 Tax=Cyclobacterium amurskyense TaxID=320787 RepID=A0A0H4PDB2_9BACT|nr:VOC family protein [Cyclobacterium amurskyense]AKP51115.1 Lactoylglutathione lyase [Cyclobacterium amurskyense]